MSTGTYRRPGVYLTETLSTQPTPTGSATAVAAFAGVAAKGPSLTPVAIGSWADYVQTFGGFDPANVLDGATASKLTSFLPYAIFSYYQNGGRNCYVVRVVPTNPTNRGAIATVLTNDGQAGAGHDSFAINANGVGTWANGAANGLTVNVVYQTLDPNNVQIFGLQVLLNGLLVETFTNLSMTGVQGTRAVAPAINDTVSGSTYITVTAATSPTAPPPKAQVWVLAGGTDPATPTGPELTQTAVTDAMQAIDAPLIVSFQPFMQQNGTIVMPTPSTGPISALNSNGRSNCIAVWDGNPQKNVTGSYTTDVQALATSLGNGESHNVLYCPWITIPDPAHAGATITCPPSGSVQGMMARVDATTGPWRTPAGYPASLSTAITAEVKFNGTDQGQLNYLNINIIRTVPGAGVCVMGGRTRKLYGPDRYVAARRTLIYVEEALRLSSQWAVFENNDTRLWASLRNTARSILQPVWEAGGLAGDTAAQAFYIICDDSINTPQVVQSGEVRMQVGVALQYPAEFVVITVSQFDSGASLVNEAPALGV